MGCSNDAVCRDGLQKGQWGWRALHQAIQVQRPMQLQAEITGLQQRCCEQNELQGKGDVGWVRGWLGGEGGAPGIPGSQSPCSLREPRRLAELGPAMVVTMLPAQGNPIMPTFLLADSITPFLRQATSRVPCLALPPPQLRLRLALIPLLQTLPQRSHREPGGAPFFGPLLATAVCAALACSEGLAGRGPLPFLLLGHLVGMSSVGLACPCAFRASQRPPMCTLTPGRACHCASREPVSTACAWHALHGSLGVVCSRAMVSISSPALARLL